MLQSFGEDRLAKIFDDIIIKWDKCETILGQDQLEPSSTNLSFLKAAYLSTLDHLKKVGGKYTKNHLMAQVPYRYFGMLFIVFYFIRSFVH